ncbi:hypothetical protein HBHAL_3857 [Halobacillus halophilus DSM 2266]|uniref:Lipoprotein n=1 Tax=Halobacillus halophilus (strain ATCC 35676 / DSM 2266 / JCM 20832 / KCTC 3685 / LMG 17431 / NBRC 102448 / NCIMB 2269) TaxID=866895 RepID=I0JPY0_HALH3|nr:DUF6612 family protein [Halobacillus halophilus]CCG46200.1 hypothetical protein HBHAL_3857 [Halobacillus halophilus DSM 2266]
MKLVMLISTLTAFILISGCASSEGAKVEEIYTKAAEASKSLENFAMKVESKQIIDTGMETGNDSGSEDSLVPGSIPIVTTIDSKMQTDPIAFHQTVEMMGQTIEQYYTEDGLYMTMPTKEGWFKAPKQVVKQLNAMGAQQQNPASQLENLKGYVDEFKLEEGESTYTLSFHSEGENVKKLLSNSLNEMMPTEQVPDDLMKNMTVNKVDYTFVVNKETYYPSSVDMEMDFSIKQNGENTHMVQTFTGEYSDFNEVGNISVPEKVKSNAKEIEGMESLFQS